MLIQKLGFCSGASTTFTIKLSPTTIVAVLGLVHWEECELVALESGYLCHCDW
ncbi:hypothetical protein [Microcoleus sp. herbarium7]|uniref:hypothetical protein n=1 Tax=Microcoleus sp. herbarium7 TaxID=3055435 RepID=UPI002FD4A72B